MYVWVDGCTVCMCVHVSVNVCVCVHDTVTSVTTMEIRIYNKDISVCCCCCCLVWFILHVCILYYIVAMF